MANKIRVLLAKSIPSAFFCGMDKIVETMFFPFFPIFPWETRVVVVPRSIP